MGLYGSDGLHGCGWTVYPKDQWDPYRTKTNYTENHGTTRMQMDRDSVTLRENPCSNKNIRSISGIRTEQKQTTRKTTEKHGGR